MSTAIQNGIGKESSLPPAPVLVTVVIPAYQCAQYIAETLNSVVAQTFASYEIIVVNDGSPDTEALDQALAPYLAQHPGKIRYIRQLNGGPSAARNRGMREARGKYIAFLDSDDTWLPSHLAKQIELLESDPSLALVYADSLYLQGDEPVGTAFQRAPQDLHVTFETLVAERCTINTSSVVASRQALLDAGGFEDQRRRSEDFDLWLRMAHRGAGMRYSPAVQVRHRAGNGLAFDDNVMKQAQIDVYEKVLLTLPITGPQAELLCDKTQELQARLRMETARQALRQGRFAEALAAAREAKSSLKSTKLTMIVAGLRFFPNGLRSAYCVYERFLEGRQNRRQARFRARLNEAAEAVEK
jgi:cellulose synthase/poly-beta-1,6-N-acetylglucosamine synthase-like glycosyltransferase